MRDKHKQLRERCGVFGMYNQSGAQTDVGDIAFLALHAMQHRGQDGAGIATSDGRDVYWHKDIGLVSEVFGARTLSRLKGSRMVMGHVHNATADSPSTMLSTQPLVMHGRDGFLAIAHNGHIVNGKYLTERLQDAGALFQTHADAEILMNLIARGTQGAGLEHGVMGMMRQARGAYALVIMTPDKLIGVRDPWGIRPLALGRLGDSALLASESCAFDAVGAEYVRELAPGEMLVIDSRGLTSQHIERQGNTGLCLFEYVYFARTDSHLDGIGVFDARHNMGKLLARQSPVEADVVAGVPDSAYPAAMGYAQESGLPFSQLLLKNRYTGRTFITPVQSMRERAVRLKLSVLRAQCEGKRIVLVDDSIVRGTNSMQLVSMVRQAGAKEVHMRIASPPVTHACHFGINNPSAGQLISAKQDETRVRELIGADTLAYLNLDSLKQAVCPGRGFCDACFSGVYGMDVRNTRFGKK